MNLNDNNEITDVEAMAIIEKELKSIPATELSKVILSGFSDLSPIQTAIKNSIKQICVKGIQKEATNYIPYVVGITILIIIGWYIFK